MGATGTGGASLLVSSRAAARALAVRIAKGMRLVGSGFTLMPFVLSQRLPQLEEGAMPPERCFATKTS